MPIRVACPSCGSALNAPDAAAGKTVKCPKCQAPMELPVPEPAFEVIDDGGFEVVDEPAPKPKRRPVEDDGDDRPRRPKKRIVDDEDDRPRRPRRDDDDDDDRPRRPRRRIDDDDERPRRKPKSNPMLLVGIIGGGVVLLLVLLIGGLWLGGAFSAGKSGVASGGSTKGPPPPGFSGIDGDRFYCFLPGVPTQAMGTKTNSVDKNGKPMRRAAEARFGRDGMEWWISNSTSDDYEAISVEFDNHTVGTTEAALLAEYKQFGMHGHGNTLDVPAWSENLKKTMITIAGKPTLEIRWNQKLILGPRPNPQFVESQKRDQQFFAVYVIAAGSRLYIIECVTKGKAPPEETLQTIRDSFEEK